MKDNETVAFMLLCCERALAYLSRVSSYDDFKENWMLQDALAHNVEQIGEKSSKLSESIRERHPEIDWIQIRGYRNRLAHDYEGTIPLILYRTVKNDLPQLQKTLMEIQDELSKEKRPH
jgi:uncharacterized protein